VAAKGLANATDTKGLFCATVATLGREAGSRRQKTGGRRREAGVNDGARETCTMTL
jgi:hypothetical protein